MSLKTINDFKVVNDDHTSEQPQGCDACWFCINNRCCNKQHEIRELLASVEKHFGVECGAMGVHYELNN